MKLWKTFNSFIQNMVLNEQYFLAIQIFFVKIILDSISSYGRNFQVFSRYTDVFQVSLLGHIIFTVFFTFVLTEVAFILVLKAVSNLCFHENLSLKKSIAIVGCSSLVQSICLLLLVVPCFFIGFRFFTTFLNTFNILGMLTVVLAFDLAIDSPKEKKVLILAITYLICVFIYIIGYMFIGWAYSSVYPSIFIA